MKTEKKPIVTEIYEALGEASMCWNPIPTGVFESSRAAEIGERLVKIVEKYASQPMSAEPTVQQLREASKNNPDTFLAGALYVIDNYKLNSPLMSSEQYSSGAIHSLGEFPTTKSMSAEQVCRWVKASEREPKKNGLYHYKEDGGLNQIVFFDKDEGFFTIRLTGEKKLKKPERVPVKKNRDEFYWLDESTAPTVKADGWVSVEDVRGIWDFANSQYNIIKTQRENAKNRTETTCLSFTANCIVDIMDEIAELIEPIPPTDSKH